MTHRGTDQRVAAVERQAQALMLRQSGATYAAIARQLGYASGSGAHKAVLTALNRVIREPAEQLLALEEARLDELLLAVWPAAKNGNLGAIDRALRVMERRARLLGLDAPTRTELTGADGGPVQVANATEELRARLEAAARRLRAVQDGDTGDG